MAIKNYTTTVEVHKSLGEIQGALAGHGARKIMVDYDSAGPSLWELSGVPADCRKDNTMKVCFPMLSVLVFALVILLLVADAVIFYVAGITVGLKKAFNP